MKQPKKRLAESGPFSNKIFFVICILIIVVTGFLAYRNSFQGVFLFDDFGVFLENEKVQSLAWPWTLLENTRRPVLLLSAAVNYTFGENDTFGCHLFNLIIHILSALVLFGIVRRACLTPYLKGRYQENVLWLALAVALIWLVHPLQTQSVTYFVQRAESLMGLFYLLAVYCSIRYTDDKRKGWAVGAVIACLLSGLTKEVAVTAPVLIFLYDRAFVSGSFKEAAWKHKLLYFGLSLTWVVMFYLLFTTNPEKVPTAGFAYKGITPLGYALSQPEIILHYLRLSVWPHPLVLDYEWLQPHGIGQILPPFAGLFLLLGILLWTFSKYPRTGFLGLSVFLILLPSSSFIPLKDLAFEHRMYLSLAPIIVLIVFGGWSFFQKTTLSPPARKFVMALFIAGIVVTFAFLTFERNKDYRSESAMWKDIVEKRPDNARAHNNYGKYLLTVGKTQEAFVHIREALSLNPDYADAHLNMGSALMQEGEVEESISYSLKAIELEPDYAIAYNNLGAALVQQDKYAEAIPYLEKALELDFKKAGVYHNLGIAYAQTGQPYKAVENVRKALQMDPHLEEAREHLEEIQRKLK